MLLTAYVCSEGMVANRDTQHCFEADGEGEISYDAQLVMVDNEHESGSGKVHVAGDELLVVRAAESATASGGEAAAALQPDNLTIRVRRTFRALALRIASVSLQHTNRCRWVRTTATL